MDTCYMMKLVLHVSQEKMNFSIKNLETIC